MPHYTTWGGTYVTRPVEIEDRDYSDNDWDINDFVIESTQADVLTCNIGGTAVPGGSTYRTDAGFAYVKEDVDGFLKLGDIKGEAIKAGIEPNFQPEVGRLRSKTTEAKLSINSERKEEDELEEDHGDSVVVNEGNDYVYVDSEEEDHGDSVVVNEGDDYVYVDSEEEDTETGEDQESNNSDEENSGESGTTFGKLHQYEAEKINYLDFWNYDAVNWYAKEDQLTDGLTKRGDIYQDKAELMQHAPKESEYRPEAQVNPVGVGYTEVEWTHFTDNVGSTAGPGGSTFITGYAEAVGLDSSTVDVMNNILGSAGPGCDDI
jgi:hypothetical protein